MQLTETEFGQVRLGGVFFDPKSGAKFQKVDSLTERGRNKHGQRCNAIGGTKGGKSKNFSYTDPVKAHKSRILNYEDE